MHSCIQNLISSNLSLFSKATNGKASFELQAPGLILGLEAKNNNPPEALKNTLKESPDDLQKLRSQSTASLPNLLGHHDVCRSNKQGRGTQHC